MWHQASRFNIEREAIQERKGFGKTSQLLLHRKSCLTTTRQLGQRNGSSLDGRIPGFSRESVTTRDGDKPTMETPPSWGPTGVISSLKSQGGIIHPIAILPPPLKVTSGRPNERERTRVRHYHLPRGAPIRLLVELLFLLFLATQGGIRAKTETVCLLVPNKSGYPYSGESSSSFLLAIDSFPHQSDPLAAAFAWVQSALAGACARRIGSTRYLQVSRKLTRSLAPPPLNAPFKPHTDFILFFGPFSRLRPRSKKLPILRSSLPLSCPPPPCQHRVLVGGGATSLTN
ncbi:hypothetical protein B0T24DRAFT_195580 [Lasiosphaeria ovina]|uniref:Uncharacterized protein n=1 Tax=Lasiosphaeria ovina TaxID=92902 RepID=A0AAE0NFC1_9PEZI|nr:hypothetical protein B0T24DRAFT_195580 [Lasiosphaeria ovina]